MSISLIACTENDRTAPSITPTISVSVSPASLSVPVGGSGQVAITLTRGADYDGAVTFSIEGGPGGVTGTFTPTVLASGSAASTLLLTVGSEVPVGTYPLTVRAAGSGVAPATATLSLTVAAPPSFGLVLTPAGLAIAQGWSATAIVDITRAAGFVASVTLALENKPAGVTGTFAPNPASDAGSILTVTVGAATLTGNYVLTIRGTTAGLADQTTTLQLAVDPATGFTLSANPATLNITPGGNSSSAITVTRLGGFTGSVTFTSTTTTPAGVTIIFNPAATSEATTTMGVLVGNGVEPGVYTITVRGNATGQPEQFVNVTLNVVATGVGGSPAAVCEQAPLARAGR
jgi:hypothetical protein